MPTPKEISTYEKEQNRLRELYKEQQSKIPHEIIPIGKYYLDMYLDESHKYPMLRGALLESPEADWEIEDWDYTFRKNEDKDPKILEMCKADMIKEAHNRVKELEASYEVKPKTQSAKRPKFKKGDVVMTKEGKGQVISDADFKDPNEYVTGESEKLSASYLVSLENGNTDHYPESALKPVKASIEDGKDYEIPIGKDHVLAITFDIQETPSVHYSFHGGTQETVSANLYAKDTQKSIKQWEAYASKGEWSEGQLERIINNWIKEAETFIKSGK